MLRCMMLFTLSCTISPKEPKAESTKITNNKQPFCLTKLINIMKHLKFIFACMLMAVFGIGEEGIN